ncbi:MAG: guanylate kinase [Ignavibacteria bacterium]|nr:guanylate kinase [Ignavibacteria bacterium]
MNIKQGHIFVISAPSGAGKTSIIRPFLQQNQDFVYSVSATTRIRRDGEEHGVDYFFISIDEFQKKLENNEFLEWEQVYDYYYGTLRSFVEKTISAGKHIVIEVDVKGALSIKRKYPEAYLIFIEPPAFEDLEKRLRYRNTESAEDLKKRLDRALMELGEKSKFDFSIVNQDLTKAIDALTKYIYSKVQGE